MKTSSISPDTSNHMLNKLPLWRRWATALLVVLFWLAVWQILSMLMQKAWLMPAPLIVATRGLELLPTVGFWVVVGHTLARIAQGFAAGMLAGLLLAVLTHVSRLADAIFSPALKAILATPVPSFSILLLIWLNSTGSVPVVVAFLVVLPVAWRNIRTGIESTDAQLLEMASIFQLSRLRKLRRIYAPSLKPHFLSACTISLGLAWKSGVAAEVISMPRLSIGNQLQAGRAYLEVPDVFVWTITVILLSLLIEWLLVGLFKKPPALYKKRGKNF